MDYKKLNNGIGRMMYSLREEKDYEALKVIINATKGHLVEDDIKEGFRAVAVEDNLSEILVTKQMLNKLELLGLKCLRKSDFPGLNEEIYELEGKKVRFELDYLHPFVSSNIVEGKVVKVSYEESRQDFLISLADVKRGSRIRSRVMSIEMQEVKAYEVEEE